jgi:dienelactone hydrolase
LAVHATLSDVARVSRLVWLVIVIALLAVTTVVAVRRPAPAGATGATSPPPVSAPYGVGEIVVTYTDHSRTVRLPGIGRVPRPIATVIRYPISGDPAQVDVRRAAPAAGPFPLIVFGHGFAVTPAPYAALMRAWVSAGYVVAAPIFPLANANAPGGPDESDLVHQPGDMSFVITRILAASAQSHGTLAGLIESSAIAVAGQSDGGSTALDAAYDRDDRDRRVDAAVVMSGADMPGMDSFPFAVGTPPLLSVQGLADPINFPSSTFRYFRLARAPKFLLELPGAAHLGPYTNQEPQLSIVERETLAFLDRYLKHTLGAGQRMWTVGNVRGLARLITHVPAPAKARHSVRTGAAAGGATWHPRP